MGDKGASDAQQDNAWPNPTTRINPIEQRHHRCRTYPQGFRRDKLSTSSGPPRAESAPKEAQARPKKAVMSLISNGYRLLSNSMGIRTVRKLLPRMPIFLPASNASHLSDYIVTHRAARAYSDALSRRPRRYPAEAILHLRDGASLISIGSNTTSRTVSVSYRSPADNMIKV